MKNDHPYFALAAISEALAERQITDKILACNTDTTAYGLSFTQQQAIALAKTRIGALKGTRRIELNDGMIDKLILSFCNSPYLTQGSYEDTLHELIGLFYEFKNETWDAVSDDDLLHFMKTAFDGRCCGSLELLSSEALAQLSRHIHSGRPFQAFHYDPEGRHERA